MNVLTAAVLTQTRPDHRVRPWWRLPFGAGPGPGTDHPAAVVAEVADRFRQARRVLNHVTDRYLMGPDNHWFTAPGHERQ